MSIRDRFLAYAAAFEESYEDDDWARLAQYFTEDAVYETDNPASGRDAVLARLKTGVDAFDRRMDSRAISFDPPAIDGDAVTIHWRVVYTKQGCPNVEVEGDEIAEFRGDEIAVLRDVFDPASEKAIGEWMAAHGATLQG